MQNLLLLINKGPKHRGMIGLPMNQGLRLCDLLSLQVRLIVIRDLSPFLSTPW